MDHDSPKTGRWHRGAKPVIYASLEPALAALEALAHAKRPLPTLALLKLRLRNVDHRTVRGLPPNWRHAKHITRRIGEDWLARGREGALFVPSALCTVASNVLIASDRVHAGDLVVRRVETFRFDKRLLAGLKPASWVDR
jgi:RES domain-containing protein